MAVLVTVLKMCRLSGLKHLKYHNIISEYREVLREQLFTISSSQSRKDKFKTDRKQTLKQCVEKMKFSSNSTEHQRFTEALTNGIVHDIMPVYTVDNQVFA